MSDWQVTRTPLRVAGERLTIAKAGRPLRVGDVMDSWQDAAPFAAALAASPFEAFYWEMPPLHADDLGAPFECVLLEAPRLGAAAPDPSAFAEHFTGNPASVVAFPNISGRTMLIAPRPLVDRQAYGHLAAFVRHAPAAQIGDCFRLLASNVGKLVDREPRWISTAGHGVPWLHIRIDREPKYYRWAPYRQDS